ncbi:hypothetical protein NLU13_8340 [Sarocladium strictum]|uniref:Peptidase C14 caspase domain-containing protein n=1 Tax=Sarocladium strictum TaxID=5046 RepID=A0AA39GDU4_SARSR|nr:hypothetical protein NLU13_8340 [Sarocladium strictum]
MLKLFMLCWRFEHPLCGSLRSGIQCLQITTSLIKNIEVDSHARGHLEHCGQLPWHSWKEYFEYFENTRGAWLMNVLVLRKPQNEGLTRVAYILPGQLDTSCRQPGSQAAAHAKIARSRQKRGLTYTTISRMVATNARHWALLIGVGFHIDPDFQLAGAANDAQAFDAFLRSISITVDITTLIAPVSLNLTLLTSNSPIDPETLSALPTLENIEGAFERILGNSAPGDHVYVHYSGHGTQLEDESLALALPTTAKGHETGLEPYAGKSFSEHLSKLVRKGVKVSVVLDCCFSGALQRGERLLGSRARTVAPAGTALSPLQTRMLKYSSGRGSTIQYEDWIVRPDGYNMLTACSPHETARELEFSETKQRRGALSFFLLDALGILCKKGVDITHRSLYHYIATLFHSFRPDQTPMRFGNEDLSFFGQLCLPQPGIRHLVLRPKRGGAIFIDAGQVHGVHKGDLFQLSPSESIPSPAAYDSATAQGSVSVVHCLESELVPQSAALADIIGTGWQAEQLSSLREWRLPVEGPASFAIDRGLVQNFHYMRLSTEKDASTSPQYYIAINQAQEYEILQADQTSMPSIPRVPVADTDSRRKVLAMLEHIAQYTYLKSLDNNAPKGSFEKSFTISASSGKSSSGEILLDLSHGSQWTLTLESKCDAALYYNIFEFSPSWGVQSLLKKEAFRVLKPRGSKTMTLQAEVSLLVHGQDVSEQDDTLKIFVTTQRTFFPSMVLPSLSQDSIKSQKRSQDSRALLQADLQQQWRRISRSSSLVELLDTDVEKGLPGVVTAARGARQHRACMAMLPSFFAWFKFDATRSATEVSKRSKFSESKPDHPLTYHDKSNPTLPGIPSSPASSALTGHCTLHDVFSSCELDYYRSNRTS